MTKSILNTLVLAAPLLIASGCDGVVKMRPDPLYCDGTEKYTCPTGRHCDTVKHSCEEGEESATSPDLRPSGTMCNGQEVDLQSDRNHCGNCTTQCSDVQGCIRGTCQLTTDECTTTKACTGGKTCKQGEFAKYCQFTCQGYNLPLKNGQAVGTFGNDPCGAGGMGGGGINCLVRSCKPGQAIGPKGQEDTNDCQSATAKREGDGVMYCQ